MLQMDLNFLKQTHRAPKLSSLLIINSSICSFRNAAHIAEWVAKSLSMDKLIPAQKATSLTERFPFQLCRHYCNYPTWMNCFQLCKRMVPAEAPQEMWPFRMCLLCHWLGWLFAGGITQSIYPHKNDCLFSFPLRILKRFTTELQRTSIFALDLFSC